MSQAWSDVEVTGASELAPDGAAAVPQPRYTSADSGVVDLAGFQRWVDASFVPLRVTSPLGETFRGRVAGVNVHGVGFTDVRGDPQLVERTPELISAATDHFYKISLQLEGASLLRQGGRSVELHPGDLAIYDTSRPYELEFTAPFRVLVIMLPHSRLAVPHGLASEFTAIRLAGSEGLGRVVSPFLATLGTNLQELRGPAGAKLAQNAVDLLDTLLANEFDLARYASDPHLSLLQQIRDRIDEHLGDPNLGPSSIAASAFISVRHLHNLFQDQGQTVASYIRTRRLERTYLDLTNPKQADESVASIGNRWGFKDPAHFSRAFKQAYGESPSEVRRQALASRASAHPEHADET
jgi:AraC-like DNA-binding protein